MTEVTLYKIGDFYEAFDADASTVAKVCYLGVYGVNGRPIVGFPYWEKDYRLNQLADAGVLVVESVAMEERFLKRVCHRP